MEWFSKPLRLICCCVQGQRSVRASPMCRPQATLCQSCSRAPAKKGRAALRNDQHPFYYETNGKDVALLPWVCGACTCERVDETEVEACSTHETVRHHVEVLVQSARFRQSEATCVSDDRIMHHRTTGVARHFWNRLSKNKRRIVNVLHECEAKYPRRAMQYPRANPHILLW